MEGESDALEWTYNAGGGAFRETELDTQGVPFIVDVHTYIHPLLSFLKQGFSKIVTKNMIKNKKEYSKYIKSG